MAGRSLEVAAELCCDWPTINDAVTTYGDALLEADTKRLRLTTAIGLDATSFVKLRTGRWRQYVTTVADVAHHQILEILPTRDFTDVARWMCTPNQAPGNRVKERLREFYRCTDIDTAQQCSAS